MERELAAARATARPPPEDDDRAVDLAAVERPATRWNGDSDGELPPQDRPPPIMVPEPGRGRGKPPLGKMKRKAPSPRLEAAATYQAWAADEDGSPRGSKPPIKKLRERLASVDVLDEVATAEASWGSLEGTAAVVGTGRLDVRRVFEVVVNLLDDEKKHELRAVGQRLKGANGGRAPLPDLVRETVALVGSERWSFAVAEAARRQSGSRQWVGAPPPLPAAVVSPPTSLPVAWQKAGLTERPRDAHSAPRPEEDASSPTSTEAVDTALKDIERRSYKPSSSDGAPPPVLPSVSSEDLGQPARTV